MSIRHLVYFGILSGIRLWDTGERLTPVEFAELKGIEAAAAAADSNTKRKQAYAKAREFVKEYTTRIPMRAADGNSTIRFAVANNGWILANQPAIEVKD